MLCISENCLGEGILSDIQDVVVDSGSTHDITSSPLNSKECKPVDVTIHIAKKGQSMKTKYKYVKSYYL